MSVPNTRRTASSYLPLALAALVGFLIVAGVVGLVTTVHEHSHGTPQAARTSPALADRTVALTPSPTPSRGISVAATSSRAPSPSAPAPTAPRTYVVQPGDDVAAVLRYFTSYGYAPLLQRFGSVITSNAGLVQPGQMITLSTAGVMFGNGHG